MGTINQRDNHFHTQKLVLYRKIQIGEVEADGTHTTYWGYSNIST